MGADTIMFVVGDRKLRGLPSHGGFCFSQWRKQSHLLRMREVWQGKRFEGEQRSCILTVENVRKPFRDIRVIT